MENKTIKQMLQDGECEYGEGNTMCLVATEETPEIFKKLLTKSLQNICDGCGEIIKHDQWSENNFTLCIDCG